MFTSLTTVCLFFIVLFGSNTAVAQGLLNGTTTSSLGLQATPESPSIQVSETILLTPTTSSDITSTSSLSTTSPSSASPSSYATTTSSTISVYTSPAIESSETSLIVPSTTSTTVLSSTSVLSSTTLLSSTESPSTSSTADAATTTQPLTSTESTAAIPAITTSSASDSAYSSTTSLSVYSSPAIASSDTSLAVPTTSSAAYSSTTSITVYSSPAIASSDTTLAVPTTSSGSALTPEAPTVQISETSLATPVSSDSSIAFSYAPATTTETSDSASSVQFTYAPETSTASSSDLLLGYIGSIAQSITPTAADGSVETSSVPIETSAAATSAQTSQAFEYAPDSSTDIAQTTAISATLVSIGSSAIPIAPIPQSYAGASSSTDPAAYVIGSQTASVGQTLTVDNTPVVVQTSAGVTQLYVGTTSAPSALSFVEATPAATQESSAVAATLSVGSSAIPIIPIAYTDATGATSTDAAAFVVGSQTASIGQTLTIDNTPVVVQTSAGATQVYAGTSAIPSALSFDLASTATSPPTATLATASIGSTALSIAPLPASYAAGDSSSAPAAFIIGSQTASAGQTLTIDNTPVVVQTSAGATQLFVGTATTSSALSFATITASASSLIGAPTTLTIGLQTVSRDSAGNYLVGTETLAPGSSIVQGSGSATAVVVLTTVSGSAHLIVQDASTTASIILPKVTSSASSITAAQESSAIVVNGHTYYLGPASLNAQATGSQSASSTFATSSKSGSASSPTGSGPLSQQNAASRSGYSMFVGGVGLLAFGFAMFL
ncbi:hypothetical protein LTR15_011636 [Elasticomyces elasticus]|nr:hypothetical protein LTR15_011636 [Elasticomyces elasticus]